MTGANAVNLTSRTNFSMAVLHGQIPVRCERPEKILKDGTVIGLPDITIYCSGCYRRKIIPPSCGKRNCARCAMKRALKMEKKYLKVILSKPNYKGHMWSFVNLTGVRVPLDKKTLGPSLRKFGNTMEQFLSGEYEDAGLVVIEHTTHYKVVRLCEILESGEFYSYQVEGPATIINYEPEL